MFLQYLIFNVYLRFFFFHIYLIFYLTLSYLWYFYISYISNFLTEAAVTPLPRVNQQYLIKTAKMYKE